MLLRHLLLDRHRLVGLPLPALFIDTRMRVIPDAEGLKDALMVRASGTRLHMKRDL